MVELEAQIRCLNDQEILQAIRDGHKTAYDIQLNVMCIPKETLFTRTEYKRLHLRLKSLVRYRFIYIVGRDDRKRVIYDILEE